MLATSSSLVAHHVGNHADLHNANMSNANLAGVDLREADLNNVNLNNTNLNWADLRNASLHNTDLSNANLSGANLSNANMSNAKLNNANLGNVKLIRTNLNGANMRFNDLRSANMNSALLSVADLSDANLSAVDLSNADLRGALLSGANLSGANLSNAYLNDADLGGTNLSGAYVGDIHIWNTTFARMNLRGVKGLTEVDHQGPSRVELHTVQLPQDGSALHFLRGTGVPNEWIDLWYATMMYPIQYHSLFISYSSQDEMLARRLHADLQGRGVRCWFAPEDLKIGDKIRSRIDEAIHLQDKLLLLLSEHALASAWVEDEVEAAMEKENQQQREILFPVRLDESVIQTTQAWAAKLRRTRHIGDFTKWMDHQAYQQAFERLLRDLKAEQKPEV